MRTSLLLLLLLCCRCTGTPQQPVLPDQRARDLRLLINPAGHTIAERFRVPRGYERPRLSPASFGYYLQQLPLQPDGSPVHLFDGSLKERNVHYAVLRIDVGNRDLQQCADAIMRLRGEYLFARKQWDELGFRFVQDNQIHYFKTTATEKSYKQFRKWMDEVFTYANTRSLYEQLRPKAISDIEAGDVLIQTGNPYGHAVIVVDMVINRQTGDKLFLLAQSYMPAQEIHILRCPGSSSAWYSLHSAGQRIETPEWSFTTGDLRSF